MHITINFIVIVRDEWNDWMRYKSECTAENQILQHIFEQTDSFHSNILIRVKFLTMAYSNCDYSLWFSRKFNFWTLNTELIERTVTFYESSIKLLDIEPLHSIWLWTFELREFGLRIANSSWKPLLLFSLSFFNESSVRNMIISQIWSSLW